MKQQENNVKVYYGLKWAELYRNMIDLFKAHNNIVDYWEL